MCSRGRGAPSRGMGAASSWQREGCTSQGWVGMGWGATGRDGMRQGTQVMGRGGMVPRRSLGLQGEGQLDASKLLPAIADGHPDTVVAVGHPGRQLHIGQDEVAGWQGVGALWREGTRRQDVSRNPPALCRRALPASRWLGVSGVPL